ncbi:MAG: hypothetical protein QXP98_00495 [Thermoproteus sp.]
MPEAVLLGHYYIKPFIGEGECDLDLLAVDGKAPPLVAVLIYLAARGGEPLAGAQEARRSLSDAIGENKLLDAAVRAAYAYAALTQGRIADVWRRPYTP